MHRHVVLAAMATVLGLAPMVQRAAAVAPVLDVELLVQSGFEEGITAIAQPPGDMTRLFIAERVGRIRIFEGGAIRATPFLDVADEVSLTQECGLTALVFDPQYQINRRFYVHYTSQPNDQTFVSWIVVYRTSTLSPDLADPAPVKVLLRLVQYAPLHLLGFLAFSPNDGLLYIGMGESDEPQLAQDINDLRGKILRINPEGDDYPEDPDRNYSIPPDNPLVGLPADEAIWATGVRNPWQASFDRLTGDLWLPDVGEAAVEELNLQLPETPPPSNYGWGCMEGLQCHPVYSYCSCGFPLLQSPLFSYTHAEGCAIIGGRVYRGCDISGLQGAYIFSDLCMLGAIYFLRQEGGAIVDLQHPEPAVELGLPVLPTCFGEDNRGELYVGTLGGSLFKIVPGKAIVDLNGNGVNDSCEFDLDGDGVIGGGDLAIMLSQWGPCRRGSACTADFTGDGVVDGEDLALLLALWD